MKRKQVILLSIILFPSLLYFLFELTQANFKKMAYYGPKTVSAKGDTIYYSVPDMKTWNFGKTHKNLHIDDDGDKVESIIVNMDTTSTIDTTRFPVYIIIFLNDSLKKEGYKLEAFFDYAQYKPTEFKNVPMFFVSDLSSISTDTNYLDVLQHGSFDNLKITLPSIHPIFTNENSAIYFKAKPVNVSNYFAVLVDKHRHIRGYYDPNQNSEVKRMVQEYKHLKTKDEYANTLNQNNIGKK